MGKKTLNIDGKEFGKKLLSTNIRIEPPRGDKKGKSKKFMKALECLRGEKTFQKNWEHLWKWRSLKWTFDLISFFQMQCLMRNPAMKEGILEAYASNLAKLDEKSSRMFTHKEDEDKFRAAFNSDPIGVGKVCAAILDDMDKFIYQNTYGRCNRPLIHYLNPNLELTDKLPDNFIYAPCVHEVFAEKKHEHDFHIDHDFKQLEIDRTNKMPTVYLRIDLRDFVMNNGAVSKAVAVILKEKTDDLKIVVQKRPTSSPKTWEFILMVHDLDKIGFTNEDIAYLIEETVKEEVSISAGSISDILKAAKIFISSATTRNYPPRIWS
jgi:hypothetical protein